MENISILYVEDDPTSRRVMQMILTHQVGVRDFTIFESSDNFLERLAQLPQKPDVIFLDINITPLDGYAMLALLRDHQHYQRTTTIALTASVMHEELDNLRNAGFDGAISKPVNKNMFPILLNQILNGEKIWYIF